MSVLRTVVLASLTLALHACTPATPAARQYELDGQILAIRPENNEVLIKHRDIKGFMPGMSMPFKVRESSLLDGKVPGDLVNATLMVADTTAWITTLDKTGAAPLTEHAAIPPASFVRPLAPGDRVPDIALIDHTGSTVAVKDWRGHVFAVTFIYVRCPLPQFCPLLDRRFAEVQRGIASDPRLSGHARLLSVSFDPDADTPAHLQVHADRLQADPDIWRFATAPRDTVDRFAAQFGVNVLRERDGIITHNMRTAVAGADGRVRRIYDGSDWTAAEILADMRHALTQ